MHNSLHSLPRFWIQQLLALLIGLERSTADALEWIVAGAGADTVLGGVAGRMAGVPCTIERTSSRTDTLQLHPFHDIPVGLPLTSEMCPILCR